MLFGNLVITADNPALEQRPERFDIIRMDRADNILALTVADYAVIVFCSEMAIARVFIGRNQCHALRDGFADVTIERVSIGILDDPCANRSATLDCADNDSLTYWTAWAFEPSLACLFFAFPPT
jgi:hypothetical protein